MSSTTPEFDREFDYIVVGAGTAGCLIASRLSESSTNRVCLIEAGAAQQHHPFIRIPAAVGAAIMSPKFGWGLSTVPQPHLNGRRVPLPRGRVIGGTGSINGMAYFRGPAKDFDDWAATGNPGWSYADLLPYFLRSENNPEYAGSPYHGTGGPMGVSFPTSRNPLCDAFNASMASLGFKEIDDFNGPTRTATGIARARSGKAGECRPRARIWRRARRRNLEVLPLTRVRRVLLDGKRAVGVELKRKGETRSLRARKEVIVCGGTFHSPHLLLHSGIGDERDLKSWASSRCIICLPSARHFRDHPAAPIAMETSDSTSYGHSWNALPRNVAQSVRYLETRRGQFASNLFEATAYIRTLPESDRPDLQIVFQPARRNPKPFPIPLGHGYAIVSVCIYPKSTGRVSLSGPDPLAEPLIDPALGSDEADLRTILRGLKMARTIFAHEAFAKYRAHEVFPGSEVASDEQWLEHIRRTLTTVHHPGSTCRMGSGGDNVVDHELKVHGLEQLRVADASIYPRLVGANTNASVVAIAEKASDMILGKPAPAPIGRRD